MDFTRRDFLKAASALAAAFGARLPEGFGATSSGRANKGPSVIWLTAAGCSGCSVSLLNSIYYMTADELLLQTINLKYHPTLMAAAGPNAVAAAQAARGQAGYVLVVEGSIPTGAGGRYCYLWPGLTALDGVRQFAQNAGQILAVGSCSAYGGVVKGNPNPTGVQPLRDVLSGRQVINIPGCPMHPDWLVGTIAHLIAEGVPPELDREGRPKEMFKEDSIHDDCPNKDYFEEGQFGLDRCLYMLGCKGPWAHADCRERRWNAGQRGGRGVNWCIGARSPCIGCTEPSFPDGMSPFYEPGSGQIDDKAVGSSTEQDDQPQTKPTRPKASAASPPAGKGKPEPEESTPAYLRQYQKRKQYEQRRKGGS